MKKLLGWTMIFSIAAVIGLLVMRVSTHAYGFSNNFFTGIMAGGTSFATAIMAAPTAINFADRRVLISGAASFLACLSLVGYMQYRLLHTKDQSGSEHGEERFANDREASALIDKKHYCNNFFFTQHAGMLFHPTNKKQKDLLYGLNFNMVTYGISGLGKSFNLAKVDMLQAVGDALVPLRPGLRNIREHICLAATHTRPPVARKTAKKTVYDGFDIFSTDPKGDNLRDVGSIYEAAGYTIKSFNTIDFSKSLHYNPLAYIKTRLIDSKCPHQVQNTLEVTFEDGEVIATDEDEPLCGDIIYTKNTKNGLITCDTVIQTTKTTFSDEAKIDKNIASDLAEIARVSGENITDVIEGFAYMRSTAVITLKYTNTHWKDQSPTFSLVLDAALEVVAPSMLYSGDASYDETSNTVTWNPGITPGRVRDVADDDAECKILKVYTQIKSIRVPDGIDLTKTITCLVKNLNEADQPPSGDGQFWEDTKMLAFMSFASYLFERYDPRYRNLPEMLELLNMAKVSDDPAATSRLDVLMEAWETGYIYLPTKIPGGRSQRGGQAPGAWCASGNDPHDPEFSLALHCYAAYNSGAPETRQSVLASCHAAMTRMLSEDIKELTRYDEMALDTLGNPNQKQAIFAIPSATDDTYGFLFALLTFQAMNLACERAARKFNGKLPRHVRFILDEVANIGKLPLLNRIISVCRSFNISISLFLQSKAQLAQVYGEKQAEIIVDNCSTMNFLGAQCKDTLSMISDLIGDETVYAKTASKTFGKCGFSAQSTNENTQSNSRKLMNNAQMRRMDKKKMLCFIYGQRVIQDTKYPTWLHPLYCYIDPTSPRALTQPVCRFTQSFDFAQYQERRRAATTQKE